MAFFQSIYFFDPKGHRLELVANTQTQDQLDELKPVAPVMLEEWNRTMKHPRIADYPRLVAIDVLRL